MSFLSWPSPPRTLGTWVLLLCVVDQEALPSSHGGSWSAGMVQRPWTVPAPHRVASSMWDTQ